jgi:hypothetical protein
VIWLIRIALWLAMLMITALGALLGFPIVGFLAWRRAWVLGRSPVGNPIWVWEPRWAWLWSDSDQGIDPYAVPTRWGAFYFVGIRNKVSNLRFLKPFGFRIDPKRIRFIGNHQNLYLPHANDARPVLWSLTWQGLYSGLWIVFKGWQLRIGWSLVPDDAKGFDPLDLRQLWCGFGFQFHRER